jgi:hypothetical protein
MSDPIYVTVDSSPPVTVSVTANPSPLSVAVTTTGDRGPTGDTGPANTLSIGTVTTGSTASATITGTAPNQTLNLTIPGAELANLSTVAFSGSASDLTSGTISTARLPASVPLLVNGLIPSAALPSYVDDVIEGTLATFPSPGEAGKLYVDTSTTPTSVYRWSGSTYIQVVGSPGTTDAIAEGSFNLYFTSTRSAAAAPVQQVAGRTGSIVLTASDVTDLGPLATLATSGKASSTTYLRGDGAWSTVATVTSLPWSSITGTPSTFTPSAHAASHGATGSDRITLASSQITGLGSLATVSPTGTASSTTFLRGDGTWAAPPGATYTAGTGITIASGAISAAVTQVAGRTGSIVLTTADVSGLGTLASKSPTGTASATTYLRGDNTWATPVGTTYTAGAGITIASGAISAAVTKVANRTGAITLTTADIGGLGTLATVSPTGTATASTFLRGDKTWATPPGTTYTAGTGISISGNTISCTVTGGGSTYTAGSGISITGTTISASVTSVAGRTGAVTLTTADVGGLGSLATQSSVAYSSLTGTPSTFAPSAHAASHGSAGSDPISIASTQVTGLGSLATVSPTGTASSSTWLRGDGSWQSITQGIGGTLEYSSAADFPQPGTAGRIYIDASRSRLYRWTSDLVYAEVGTVQGSSAARPSPAPIVAALIAG